MTQRANTAKTLLSEQQHLLGFVDCGREHIVRRASSAKVFVVQPVPSPIQQKYRGLPHPGRRAPPRHPPEQAMTREREKSLADEN